MTDEARAQAEREIAAVNAAMMGGCGLGFCSTKPSAIRVAARELGVDRNGLRDRVGTPDAPGRYFRQHGLMPDWSLASRAEPIIVPEAPRWSAPKMSEWRKPGERLKARSNTDDVLTVLAIGDHHDAPGVDKVRATWIGRFAAEKRPDCIVSIGDWASLDSLSSHEMPGSAKHAAMTSFAQDLESLEDSLEAFHRDLPVGSIPTFITLGNHEDRAWRAANQDPKRCGDIPVRLEQAFAQFRWNTVEYGQHLTLAGCDFVHSGRSIMGKDFGGEHVERTIANKALRSTVVGHTHRRGMFNAPKIGSNQQISVLNLGTSMPFGKLASYARLSQTGWSYGIYLLRLHGGVIVSEKFWDMRELAEIYGD